VLLVVVHVVFHIVISLDDVSERDDERDRAVSRRASVLGYNVLLAGLVISEVAYYASQLYLYRRGVTR
jgi:hypothetical protein